MNGVEAAYVLCAASRLGPLDPRAGVGGCAPAGRYQAAYGLALRIFTEMVLPLGAS